MLEGGKKQRDYMPKQEASSPTLDTEVVFSTAAIEAMKGGNMVIVDIPNDFVKTDSK